jgi:hypothetical protein
VLKASLVNKKISFTLDKKDNISSFVSKGEYNRCKEIFTPNRIELALNELELRHKIVDEIDIYNVIEYVLATNREK